MKRVYKLAKACPVGPGWHVLLDDKPLLTPKRRLIELPSPGLATAIAEEWQFQEESVEPRTMPLTRLAFTAFDWVEPNREQVIGSVAGFAESDLLCYRAERPQELVARQLAIWQPLVDWVALRYDAPFVVTSGVMPRPQPPEALAAMRSAVAACGTLPLMALHEVTTACGSVILGLALLTGRIDAVAAWHASQLDEKFQSERWGEDAEAIRRAAMLRDEIDISVKFLRLLGLDN